MFDQEEVEMLCDRWKFWKGCAIGIFVGAFTMFGVLLGIGLWFNF